MELYELGKGNAIYVRGVAPWENCPKYQSVVYGREGITLKDFRY